MGTLLTLGIYIIASTFGLIVIETTEIKASQKLHEYYIQKYEPQKNNQKGCIVFIPQDTTNIESKNAN